jgi:peptide chain release factor subunit 1
MLEVKKNIGLLTLDRREAMFAMLKGKHVEIIRHLTSGVPGKHRHGGQSARRFERLIEIAAHEFMKRVAENAKEIFSQVPDLEAIIVGGPGPTKDEFLKSGLLNEQLQRKVAASLDTGYTDEQGIKELVNKAGDVLTDLEITREKSLVQRFMQELVAGKGLVAYGERDVRRAIELGAVELLLVSEGLCQSRVTARCQACGHELRETVKDVERYKRQLVGQACPKCNERKLSLVKSEDVVQELVEQADKFGSKVEFISTETEEGKQLLIAFKGLVAFLRFRPAA